MKKGYGDGSVYPSGDGWRVVVPVDGRRRYGRAATQREAEGLRRLWVQQRDQGILADRAPMTIERWLTTWVETIAPRRCRDTTLAGYRSLIRTWLIPELGRVKLDDIRPEHVEQLHDTMRLAGRSTSTVRAAHAVLSRALRVAEQRGHVHRNVARLVDIPGCSGPEIRPLPVDDVRAVLREAAGDRFAARWFLALVLGLRQGEALAVEWRHIDFDAGTIRIEQQLQRLTGRGLDVVPVKTDAGVRDLSLPPTLLEALRRRRHEQLVERIEEGQHWRPWLDQDGVARDFVFSSRRGRPVEPRKDRDAWKALCDRAGANPSRLHDARHTAATLLLLQGEDPRTVQGILGHATEAMTRRYQHLIPELAAQAAARIEASMFGGQHSGSGSGSSRHRQRSTAVDTSGSGSRP